MFHLGLYVTGVLYLTCRQNRAGHEASLKRVPFDVAVSNRCHLVIVFLAQFDLLPVGNDAV